MIADQLRRADGTDVDLQVGAEVGRVERRRRSVMTRLDVDATDDYLLSVSAFGGDARVNVNGRNINVFSTHLDHQSSSTRLTQVSQLVLLG